MSHRLAGNAITSRSSCSELCSFNYSNTYQHAHITTSRKHSGGDLRVGRQTTHTAASTAKLRLSQMTCSSQAHCHGTKL
jgi:hypothetical protein